MYDFTPDEWQELFDRIDFTDEEKEIIRFRRRGWTWINIAAELYMSERQIYRASKKINIKILKSIERT